LDSGFRLTKFSELRGWGCKVPQELLHRLLEGLESGFGQDHNQNEANNHESNHYFHQEMGLTKIGISRKLWFDWYLMIGFSVGIGMDSSVIPLRHAGLVLIQTVDYFYPLVEDPYIMVSSRGSHLTH
jgi:selenide,water dikinase